MYFSSVENLAPTDTDVDTVDAYERTPGGALVHLSDSKVGPDFNDVSAYVAAVTPDGRRAYFTTREPLLASERTRRTTSTSSGRQGWST